MTQRILAFLCALFAVALVPQQAGAQTVPGPAYRINPGDDLEISVWGDDRLAKVVRVLPDGTFGFPLVGTVMAAGLLPADVQRILTAGLKPQYKDVVPQVTVSIKPLDRTGVDDEAVARGGCTSSDGSSQCFT